jgi:hypothetical protein
VGAQQSPSLVKHRHCRLRSVDRRQLEADCYARVGLLTTSYSRRPQLRGRVLSLEVGEAFSSVKMSS